MFILVQRCLIGFSGYSFGRDASRRANVSLRVLIPRLKLFCESVYSRRHFSGHIYILKTVKRW